MDVVAERRLDVRVPKDLLHDLWRHFAICKGRTHTVPKRHDSLCRQSDSLQHWPEAKLHNVGRHPRTYQRAIARSSSRFSYQLGVVFAASAPFIEASLSRRFSYGHVMGTFVGLAMIITIIVIAAGPEAHRVVFGRDTCGVESVLDRDVDVRPRG